jgi:hypothetical protein
MLWYFATETSISPLFHGQVFYKHLATEGLACRPTCFLQLFFLPISLKERHLKYYNLISAFTVYMYPREGNILSNSFKRTFCIPFIFIMLEPSRCNIKRVQKQVCDSLHMEYQADSCFSSHHRSRKESIPLWADPHRFSRCSSVTAGIKV